MPCPRCGSSHWSPRRSCPACGLQRAVLAPSAERSLAPVARAGPLLPQPLQRGLAALAVAAGVAVGRQVLPSLLAWSGRRVWRALVRRRAHRPVTLVEELYIRRVRVVGPEA